MGKSLPTEQWMNCAFDCRFDETRAHASGCQPFQIPSSLAEQLKQSRKQDRADEARSAARKAAQPDYFERAAELTDFLRDWLVRSGAQLSPAGSLLVPAKLAGALLAEYEIRKRPFG